MFVEIKVKLTPSDCIKGLLQFGLKNSLRWASLALKLSKRIGRVNILFARLIGKGIDLDGDGKFEGAEIELKSFLMEGRYNKLEILLDGEPVPLETSEVIVGGKSYKLSELSKQNPLELLPGMDMTLRFFPSKELRKKHSLLLRVHLPMIRQPSGAEFDIELRKR